MCLHMCMCAQVCMHSVHCVCLYVHGFCVYCAFMYIVHVCACIVFTVCTCVYCVCLYTCEYVCVCARAHMCRMQNTAELISNQALGHECHRWGFCFPH